MKKLSIAICVAALTLPLSINAAEKTSNKVIRDVAKTERNFYKAYNELNSESRFHVICKKEAATGSRIAPQVCRSKAVRKLVSKINKSKMRTGLAFVHADSKNKLQQAQQDTLAHIEKVVGENPSLVQMLVDLSNAKAQQLAKKS